MSNRPSAKRGILIFILGVVVGFVLCFSLLLLLPMLLDLDHPREAEVTRILDGVVGMAEDDAVEVVCKRVVDETLALLDVETDPAEVVPTRVSGNIQYRIGYLRGDVVLRLSERGGVVTEAGYEHW